MFINKWVILIYLFFIGINKSPAQNTIVIGKGTIIMTMISNDSIIIAADTKHVLATEGHGHPVEVDTVRKIHRSGNFFFALSGLTEIRSASDNKRTFDAIEVFKECLHSSRDLQISLSDFNSHLTSTLRALYKTRQIDKLPTDFPDTIFLGVSIVNYKNVSERLFGEFRITGSTPGDLSLKWRPHTVQSIPYIDDNGRDTYVHDFLNKHKEYFADTHNMLSKMVNLIKVQARFDSTQVGCPIDAVTIKDHSYKWARRIDNCRVEGP